MFYTNPNDKQLAEKQAEIERIEDAVSHIRFPLTFSDQVYNLRSHIDIVRRKIAARVPLPGRVPAELGQCPLWVKSGHAVSATVQSAASTLG